MNFRYIKIYYYISSTCYGVIYAVFKELTPRLKTDYNNNTLKSYRYCIVLYCIATFMLLVSIYRFLTLTLNT